MQWLNGHGGNLSKTEAGDKLEHYCNSTTDSLHKEGGKGGAGGFRRKEGKGERVCSKVIKSINQENTPSKG